VAEKRHTVVDRIADMISSANPQFQLKAVKAISTFAMEGLPRLPLLPRPSPC
jgi:hypothetical protein